MGLVAAMCHRMRVALMFMACWVSLACSSSSTNEAPGGGGNGGATGGSGGATGGSAGATGGSGGATGGSGGATGGSAGAAGGSGGAIGGSGGSAGTGGSGGGPLCSYQPNDGSFDCKPHKLTSMAVDQTSIFWALRDNDGVEHLFRAPKASPPATLGPWAQIGSVGAVGDILVDGSHVYVGTTAPSRQLIRFALGNAAEQVLVDTMGCPLPYPRVPLAMDAQAVYFACNGSADFVGHWNKSTNMPGTTFTYDTSVQATISGLASNDSTLTLAFGDLDYYTLPSGPIGLIAAAGGFVRTAMINNIVYAQTADAVKTFTLGGGGGADAMSGVAGIFDFRVDSAGTFAILADKVVGRKHSSLGNPFQKAATPGGIALDATHVYWSNVTGTVERAQRSVILP